LTLASLVQVEKGQLLIRFLLHSHILNAKLLCVISPLDGIWQVGKLAL